jgi:hypothetical protein
MIKIAGVFLSFLVQLGSGYSMDSNPEVETDILKQVVTGVNNADDNLKNVSQDETSKIQLSVNTNSSQAMTTEETANLFAPSALSDEQIRALNTPLHAAQIANITAAQKIDPITTAKLAWLTTAQIAQITTIQKRALNSPPASIFQLILQENNEYLKKIEKLTSRKRIISFAINLAMGFSCLLESYISFKCGNERIKTSGTYVTKKCNPKSISAHPEMCQYFIPNSDTVAGGMFFIGGLIGGTAGIVPVYKSLLLLGSEMRFQYTSYFK